MFYVYFLFFFFNDTATTEIYTRPYTLSLHDALPIWDVVVRDHRVESVQGVHHPGAQIDEPYEGRPAPLQLRDHGLVEFLDEGDFVGDARAIERLGCDRAARDAIRVDVGHDADHRRVPDALGD